MSPERQPSLARALGRTTAMLFCAAMIVGTGMFATLGAAAAMAAGAILLVTAMNILGVKFNARVLIVLLFVELAFLGAFVVLSAPSVRPSHLAPVLGDRGLTGTLAGAAIFFWSWDGFVRPAIMASEIKDPRR